MRFFASRFLCLSALSLISLGALGASPTSDSGDAGDEVALRPDQRILVTASREAETAFEALAPVIVIDRNEIERALAPDVGDLLRFHAGIDIAQVGGPGQTTTAFIRGANSNHTLTLVDGVRINPGTLGVAALQNIAPELIDHIEIVKGPRSSLYGTDAIGGVINVITRAGNVNRLDALVGGGRWGTHEAAASGVWAGAAGSLSFGANLFETAGFPTLASQTQDSGYRNGSATVAGRTNIGGLDLGARYWRASGNQQYAGYDSNFSLAPLDQDYVNSSFAVDAGGNLTARWHSKAIISHVVDDIRQKQSADAAITHRNAIDWQNDIDAGAQRFTVGGLAMRENTRALSFGTQFDIDTSSQTWYAEDHVTLGKHRLLGAVGFTHHSTFGDHTTWNAEYGYAPAADTLLTVGAGTGFRAPDSTDRFGYGGNPLLKPEQARNLEVGVRHRISARQSVAVTAFDNNITDLVAFAYLPTDADPYAGHNENIGRARIRGIEASWDYASDAWTGHAEVSRQDPLNRDDGSRLLRRSRLSAAASLSRRFGAQDAAVDVLASDARSDYGYPSNVRLGGYMLVNASWRTPLIGGLKLQIRVENLFDKRYEYASGYNTMRRAVSAALRYSFL
ncbi:MAG: TonB-dependent receptor [Pseudomonadota bacterium]